MEHEFTSHIYSILEKHFGKSGKTVFENSLLMQYLNEKTRSANKGSKARGSFANLYAIYVVIEDYVSKGYLHHGNYSEYEGAVFSKLFARQRELPFGEKLQNHALNNRMNAEFQKYFPNCEYVPILRNLETNRYWINENLLKIHVGKRIVNIAPMVIEIIDDYVATKQDAFHRFVNSCQEMQRVGTNSPQEVESFILGLLVPNVDARLFEIVSYAILKYHYSDQQIYWGYQIDKLTKENLQLFKTGRTNANDGGIDFVMRPLGRFFQVTETLDFKKYFLDIDKIQKYPISFVVKTEDSKDKVFQKIKANAIKSYSITAIVDRYMSCIEEIITIPVLVEYFEQAVKQGYLSHILNEIVLQSKIEFNFES